MRFFASYFLAAIFACIALIVIPVERFFEEMMDTRKIIENVKTAELYHKLTKSVSEKFLAQKQIALLKDTPLMPTGDEAVGVIEKTFPEEWFYNNLSEAHSRLIETLKFPDAHTDRTIGILISDRKNLLVENIVILVGKKLDELPHCTYSEWFKMSQTFLQLSKYPNREIQGLNISCKPPQQFQNALLKIFQNQIEKAVDVFPDSLFLELGKKSNVKPQTAFEILQSVYRFSRSFTVWGYGSLFLCLVLISLVNYPNLPNMAYRLGFAFICSAFLVASPFVWFLTKGKSIFSLSAMGSSSGELSTEQMSDTSLLAISFIRSSVEQFSWNLIYFAGLILIIGIGLMAASRIMKIQPYRH